MKLQTTPFVSVDEVMQGVGAPDEDRSGGFEPDGRRHSGTPSPAFLNQSFGRADAFLFGRQRRPGSGPARARRAIRDAKLPSDGVGQGASPSLIVPPRGHAWPRLRAICEKGPLAADRRRKNRRTCDLEGWHIA